MSMRLFTIYSLATGEILRFGKCSEGDLELQAQEGEGMLADAQGNPRTQIVDLAGEEPDLVDRPPPSLAAQKQTLLSRLAERRWQIETGGIAFSGVQIRTDRESQAMLAGALNLATLNPELLIKWKAADGAFASLDAAAIQAAALAVGSHIQACFAREADLSVQIGEAPDVEAITALDDVVSTFWPP